MREIWRAGRLTVKGAMEALKGRLSKDFTRNTTLVQLQRLEKKGWIRHEKEGRAYYYAATVGYDEAAAELGREFREKLFDGSSVELLRCLTRDGGLDADELRELRALVDQLEPGEKGDDAPEQP